MGMLADRSATFKLTDVKHIVLSSPMVRIHQDEPVRHALPSFARGIHRVAVVDDQHNYVDVLTQSDVVAHLAAHPDALGVLAGRTLKQAGVGSKHFVRAHHDERVVDVFTRLHQCGVRSHAEMDVHDSPIRAPHLTYAPLRLSFLP